MANKALIMSKVRQILKLYSKGIGKKKIASQLAVSKNTVKHYIDFYLSQKISYQEIERFSDLELNNFFHPPQSKAPPDKLVNLYECFPDIEKQLRKRGMTLSIQFGDYEKNNPDGFKSTQFYHYYHLWSKKVHPSMVIQHVAGDKMYVDYAGGKLSYVEEATGEIRQGEVFVAILGWSQYAYVEVVPSPTRLVN